MLWQSWQGGIGPYVRDGQMMLKAMSYSYVMTNCVSMCYIIHNISQLVWLSVQNLRVQSYWLMIKLGRSPYTRRPGVDEESGELKGRWMRSGRRVDEKAGGIRDEFGITLDYEAVVWDDNATVEVGRPRWWVPRKNPMQVVRLAGWRRGHTWRRQRWLWWSATRQRWRPPMTGWWCDVR